MHLISYALVVSLLTVCAVSLVVLGAKKLWRFELVGPFALIEGGLLFCYTPSLAPVIVSYLDEALGLVNESPSDQVTQGSSMWKRMVDQGEALLVALSGLTWATIGVGVAIIGVLVGLVFFVRHLAKKSEQRRIHQQSALTKQIAENKEKVIGWQLVDEQYLSLPSHELQARVDRAGVFSDDLAECQVYLDDLEKHGGNSSEAERLKTELEETQSALRKANVENSLLVTIETVAAFRERAQHAIHYLNNQPG